jgi:hypothetical protein
MTAATINALLNCGAILLLIGIVCAVPVWAAMKNAKMDVKRDREER